MHFQFIYHLMFEPINMSLLGLWSCSFTDVVFGLVLHSSSNQSGILKYCCAHLGICTKEVWRSVLVNSQYHLYLYSSSYHSWVTFCWDHVIQSTWWGSTFVFSIVIANVYLVALLAGNTSYFPRSPVPLCMRFIFSMKACVAYQTHLQLM